MHVRPPFTQQAIEKHIHCAGLRIFARQPYPDKITMERVSNNGGSPYIRFWPFLRYCSAACEERLHTGNLPSPKGVATETTGSPPLQYGLDLGLFRDLQSILDLDTQIPDSTLQFRVPQK